ncbi:hypothetical protein IAQ61_000476 [Plenodomus lingam]|uniref:uncharacterized protein n=1 Tax=Leptosphaeria maculans TaxID=5022 RepID=UPI00332B097C|nr:hypothetical protein IAQ61_000476 [Plenodomus lingam]
MSHKMPRPSSADVHEHHTAHQTTHIPIYPFPSPSLDHDPSPSPPSAHTDQPDGGSTAWLQVLGAWILFFHTWGAMNTFGVFQAYYESGILFQRSSSDIAWIGSIQTFCLQSMGLVAGPIYDRGGFRALIGVGSLGIVVRYVVLSFVSQTGLLWRKYLLLIRFFDDLLSGVLAGLVGAGLPYWCGRGMFVHAHDIDFTDVFQHKTGTGYWNCVFGIFDGGRGVSYCDKGAHVQDWVFLDDAGVGLDGDEHAYNSSSGDEGAAQTCSQITSGSDRQICVYRRTVCYFRTCDDDWVYWFDGRPILSFAVCAGESPR